MSDKPEEQETQGAIEELIAAQLASGMLGLILDPKAAIEKIIAVSLAVHQIVLLELRKQGGASPP